MSLRGLGVSSTPVSIDGLRSAHFPINDDGHNPYVDLNSIPFDLIDRIEVLKDGASSLYGADAIGGIVNLILKTHVTGVAGAVEAGVAEKGMLPVRVPNGRSTMAITTTGVQRLSERRVPARRSSEELQPRLSLQHAGSAADRRE